MTRRVLQPPFDVDFESPLAHGLILDCFPGHGPQNYARNQGQRVTYNWGADTGVSITAGPYGKQMTFVGTQTKGWINYGHIAKLTGATAITATCLFYVSTAPSGNHQFFCSWGNSVSEQSWLISYNVNGAFVWAVQDGGTGYDIFTSANSLIASGGWYNITGTWFPNTGKQYINGVDVTGVDSGSGTPATLDTGDLKVTVGSPASGQANLLGNFVFGRIWNRVLSQAEVIALYHDPMLLYRRRRRFRVPTAVTGRIWKLAGYGGGLVGPQKGLAA